MAEIFTHTAENGVSVVQIQSPDFDSLELREILLEQLPAFLRLFLEKNAEYGDNAHVLGPRGQFADIWRKIGKLKTALWDDNEDQLTSESADDVLRDLIGHCFLVLQQRARLRPRDEDGDDSEDIPAIFEKAQTGGEWPTPEQSNIKAASLFQHMLGDLTPAEEIERGPGSGGDGAAIDEKISAPNGDSRWPFGANKVGLIGDPNGRPNDLVTRVSSGPTFDPEAASFEQPPRDMESRWGSSYAIPVPTGEVDIRAIIRQEMAAVAEQDVEPVETEDGAEWAKWDWREASCHWLSNGRGEWSIRVSPPASSGLKPYTIHLHGGARFVHHHGKGPVFRVEEMSPGEGETRGHLVRLSALHGWHDARFLEPEHGAQRA